jgi:ACT domain-containing protein
MGEILTDTVAKAIELLEADKTDEANELIKQFDDVQKDVFFKYTGMELETSEKSEL